MNDRLREAGRRALDRAPVGPPGSTRREVTELRERVRALEDEMQEARRLNRRLAEVLDVVEELLVPLSQRDEAKVQAYLEAHPLTP